MADCELLATCPFFQDKMADKPATAEMYKKQYCRGENSNCARYMIFRELGREMVPPDLFPNQTERAEEILIGK